MKFIAQGDVTFSTGKGSYTINGEHTDIYTTYYLKDGDKVEGDCLPGANKSIVGSNDEKI